MKKNLYKGLLILSIVGLSNTAKAQCDSIASLCAKHIIAQFLIESIIKNPRPSSEILIYSMIIYRFVPYLQHMEKNRI